MTEEKQLTDLGKIALYQKIIETIVNRCKNQSLTGIINSMLHDHGDITHQNKSSLTKRLRGQILANIPHVTNEYAKHTMLVSKQKNHMHVLSHRILTDLLDKGIVSESDMTEQQTYWLHALRGVEKQVQEQESILD